LHAAQRVPGGYIIGDFEDAVMTGA
jgi:hypothetical protein